MGFLYFTPTMMQIRKLRCSREEGCLVLIPLSYRLIPHVTITMKSRKKLEKEQAEMERLRRRGVHRGLHRDMGEPADHSLSDLAPDSALNLSLAANPNVPLKQAPHTCAAPAALAPNTHVSTREIRGNYGKAHRRKGLGWGGLRISQL